MQTPLQLKAPLIFDTSLSTIAHSECHVASRLLLIFKYAACHFTLPRYYLHAEHWPVPLYFISGARCFLMAIIVNANDTSRGATSSKSSSASFSPVCRAILIIAAFTREFLIAIFAPSNSFEHSHDEMTRLAHGANMLFAVDEIRHDLL